MKIRGYSNAAEVARSIGLRLCQPATGFAFSLVCVEFGHNSLDNWYAIRFSKRVSRCEQNLLEKAECEKRGFIYA